MVIKTITFGRIELNGKDVERLIQHISEDKPTLLTLAGLERGREVFNKAKRGRIF